MFTNCNAVTIYEKIVGADGFPAYLAHSIRMVYWEQCTGQTANQTAQKSTMAQSHSIYLAIPAASLSDYSPKHGDLIAKGMRDVPPPTDSYTVMTVTDCRYGSAAVQHIEVTAT